jgi:hypothetical protein
MSSLRRRSLSCVSGLAQFRPPLAWDAMTSTLIFGEHDAALVDTLTTVAEAEALGSWVALQHRKQATQYLGLLWEGLMVSLLLGVASTPKEDEIKRRAGRATSAFLQLHARAGTS